MPRKLEHFQKQNHVDFQILYGQNRWNHDSTQLSKMFPENRAISTVNKNKTHRNIFVAVSHENIDSVRENFQLNQLIFLKKNLFRKYGF